MKLTKERQKETGAFYTPKVWADMAVSYFKNYLDEDLSEFVFWDVAGGEGALLDALPHNVRRIGTTLELEDMLIMRSKGIEAYQFDFLDGDLESLPFYKDLDKEKLVVFTNPPYMRLKKEHDCYAKRKYGTNAAEDLFIMRICLEVAPKILGIFTKAATIQLCGKVYEETFLHHFFTTGFASCSKQDWNLSGVFGILFSLFDFENYSFSGSNRINENGKLYYTYWSDKHNNKVDTRTDIENLGQYVKGFDVYPSHE